jgi:bla regulator protein BlaR1
MSSAGHVLETAFARVLHVSWQAALLILLIVTVQWLLRGRISAAWRHAMWGLVLVRLLLLWTVPAPFSVYNAVQGTLSRFRPNTVVVTASSVLPQDDVASTRSTESSRAATSADDASSLAVEAPAATLPVAVTARPIFGSSGFSVLRS